MAAITPFLASHVSSSSSSNLVFFVSNNSPFPIKQQQQQQPMFSLLFFIFIFSFTLYLFFFIYKKFNKTNQKQEEREEEKQQQQQQNEEDPSSLLKPSLSKIFDKTHQTRETDPTHLTHSLLLEILPSDSAKWAGLFGEKQRCEDPESLGSGQEREADGSGGDQREKKKKRRGKKKRLDLNGEEEKGEGNPGSGPRVNPELVCLYPFTSRSSATQRKIKQQYDQLVKCHESKGLTLAQVGEFANCLIEARSELQHKSEVIKRKFTITKALLFKADRSSFDRLRQQIYKLEMEQKRLEEDAFVYNWLQQQLKLSPAYKKMLEISACIEMKAKSGELMESTDTEFADISFEELLAQEKKDSFWQKNGKSRLCSG